MYVRNFRAFLALVLNLRHNPADQVVTICGLLNDLFGALCVAHVCNLTDDVINKRFSNFFHASSRNFFHVSSHILLPSYLVNSFALWSERRILGAAHMASDRDQLVCFLA